MYYDDDNMLMLSGIQHYMYCPRQWGLIHLEQQWDDNQLTVEGQLLHKNVDNPASRQKNGNTITLRSVHIASHSLGLYGITDAVELIPSPSEENSITHPRYKGYWRLYPIEYKRGHSKPDERDKVQLAAQAICLEEMCGIHIPEAALYYHETKHREVVTLDSSIRQLTYDLSAAMHKTFASGVTPKAVEQRGCKNCSVSDICVPTLSKKTGVSIYLKNTFDEETA